MATTDTARVRTTRALGAGLGLLLACLVGPGLSTSAQAAEPLPPTTRLEVTGHGWGHGHGMSQYGAQGAALQGRSWRQIVDFYYPGTTHGQIRGMMRVNLTEDTSPNVVVVARSGLVLKNLGTGKQWNLGKTRPGAERWRIEPLDARRSRVDFRRKGVWRTVLTSTGPLQFTANGAPIGLVLPGGDVVTYRGSLRSATPAAGGRQRDTVNVLTLENYLLGVVPRESPASWRPAALQAQSVAARSFAAYERRYDAHGHFDVYDTTVDQAYGGYAAEHPNTNRAVAATRWRILTHRGAPAFTQFSSSMGGFTLAGGKPYLVSQADPYEKYGNNPNMTWRRTLTVADLKRAWPRVGEVLALRLTKEPDTGGRYVRTVVVDGTRGDVTVTGWDFRNRFDLKSPWFGIRTVKG